MNKLALLLVMCGIGASDIHTDDKPLVGCYKTNGDNRCIEVTQLDCNQSRENLVRLYGAVVGDFCASEVYYDRKVKQLRNEVLRLKRRSM